MRVVPQRQADLSHRVQLARSQSVVPLDVPVDSRMLPADPDAQGLLPMGQVCPVQAVLRLSHSRLLGDRDRG